MARLYNLPPRLGNPIDVRIARPPASSPFYDTKEWRNLVTSLIESRGRLCERCGHFGGKLIGDHIRELRDGGAKLDPRNVRLLCDPCHKRKTHAEAVRRASDP